ncbi:unnamed protein product [Oppiella nova]|uniref:Uncharacterized protein n=1 Tax=Oppiella nova TaxID=334625 RepID=A0A7R9R1C0_9ACAR|nr:unnamed protein product [Oppiella nova]CAG2183404.1 unnamed protein product [Oppiella nova]
MSANGIGNGVTPETITSTASRATHPRLRTSFHSSLSNR